MKNTKCSEFFNETVMMIADCNMILGTAAKKLYIHRNTLDYRCETIKKFFGLDPRNFYDLQKLVVMVKQDNDIHFDPDAMFSKIHEGMDVCDALKYIMQQLCVHAVIQKGGLE